MSRDLELAVEDVQRLERASGAELDDYLLGRLELLLRHAADTTPYYRRALARAGFRAGRDLTPEIWRRIPLLERATLRDRPQEMSAANVPLECGPTAWIHSSGSTGSAIRILGTAQQAALWNALTVCEHLEHGRDASGRLAAIRVMNGPHGRPPEGTDLPDWGPPVSVFTPTGPAAVLGIDADSRTQARWLAARDPHYLLTYPSNLAAVAGALRDEGLSLPSLRQVRTVSEALGEETRAVCRERLGAEIADVYSAVEVGYLATQTPDLSRYRCRTETVLVEVLDETGAPAPPGEPGRVAVTALYSFAMPLVRYLIDDMAVAHDRSLWCGAPRHLDRIAGRRRGLMRLPDGSLRWPRLGLRRMNELVPLRQAQVVQTAVDAMVLKVVCDEPLAPARTEALRHHLLRRFHSIARVEVVQVDAIPRDPGGKFEEFRCDISP